MMRVSSSGSIVHIHGKHIIILNKNFEQISVIISPFGRSGDRAL